jgi:hypothetical protein
MRTVAAGTATPRGTPRLLAKDGSTENRKAVFARAHVRATTMTTMSAVHREVGAKVAGSAIRVAILRPLVAVGKTAS